MQRADAAGGGVEGRGRGPNKKGEGRANCCRRLVAGKALPYYFIPPHMTRESGWCGDALWDLTQSGSLLPDCVKSHRASAALALSLTVTTLSLLFWDILCLL